MASTRHGIVARRLLCVAAFVSIGSLALAEPEVIRLSEPVEATDAYEIYGAAMPEHQQPIPLATLLDNPDDYCDKSVVVVARVSEVCQKKGCFFIAKDGAATVRVSFKDYGFFMPTDIGGRRVTLVGELTRHNVSAEQAAHLKEDLGSDDAAVSEGLQYEIVATAVRVPRS